MRLHSMREVVRRIGVSQPVAEKPIATCQELGQASSISGFGGAT